MDSFRNKLIPSKINRERDLGSQEDYCNNSECEKDPEIDCGCCLFSERFCKIDIFQDWKNTFKETNDE